jgi:IMP dehydrogenase
MNLRKSKGLTFDDVLLVPKRSSIRSRSEVSTATFLTKNIALNLPIISANMDTVTEFNMAIAMARAGGIGIIHRFMTVSQQVRQIERVKRAEGFIVSDPYRIDQKASLEDAERLMEDHGVGGLIVTDNQKKVIGIITRRDIFLAPDRQLSVKNVMTLPDQIISAQPGITLEEARQLLYEHRLEKLPIMDDQGNLVGLITAQDVVKSKRFPAATCDDQGRLRVGAAIGITKGEEDRAADLLAAGADVLVLDIAHGHADHCLDMVRILRERHPDAQIIAGNVATRDGARDLAEVGADAVKVGIGPGSICTTRIVTGFGVPQLTAVADAVAGIKESGRDIPVIADGGIRTSGDMVKALAAGASSVMIGSLFAGCEEAPGNPIIRDGKKVKVVRGMASLGAAISRQATTKEDDESAESQEDWDKVIPEGVEAVVPYRGYVREILHQLGGGLRSGLSYGGARTIAELQENAEFIEITPAGSHESGHHDVLKL